MLSRRLLECGMVVAAVLNASGPLRAGEVMAPATERFASAGVDDVPDFQRHVVPLLGRLGCNGRACHGSFQGRGGMRLSLFGYDFEMDHAALIASSDSGRRVDLSVPANSLVIRKPALLTDHEGGRRFQQGAWQQHLLESWIGGGGARPTRQPLQLKTLLVAPEEIVFDNAKHPVPLQITAVWENGDREDVTCLCRFRTNDDSIAEVDAHGTVRSTGRGDTSVVVFYDNGVAVVPVMRPWNLSQSHVDAPSQTLTAGGRADSIHPVDLHVQTKLRKLGIASSELCSDTEFLRRISIDMTGTLPTPAEVREFLRDTAGDKRERKIDELMSRPSFAAWWANKLCDFTGCNPSQQAELGQELSVQWYMWIYERLRENTPYDELVSRIVLAQSRQPQQSYEDYAAEMSAYFREQSPADFGRRATLPHYWTRRNLSEPADKAQALAHSFLGIRLQCAQCHKHPWDAWTQDDFKQFAAFFEPVKFGVRSGDQDRYRQLAKSVGLNVRGDQGAAVRKDVLRHAASGRTVPWRELYISSKGGERSLSLLRNGVVQLNAGDDPRVAIMQWMTRPENPWFAKAFVNRVWATYFHIGIVDPPDDLNPANPPSNPALLDFLATGFVQHEFDMHWLHRQIVTSQTYQRSWKPNATNREDRRNFSRAIPRRIPAEVVYDALKQVTVATDQQSEVRSDLTRRAIGHLSMRLAGTYAMHVFGKPERSANCDCERVNQPTLLQSVFLQNDPLVEQRLADSGWVAEIEQAERAGKPLDHGALAELIWLRSLSRFPTAGEKQRAMAHLVQCESLAEGVTDLLWAVVNTKEFILNH